MDPRWHGLSGLRTRVSSSIARVVAPLRYCRHQRQHRLLRIFIVRVVSNRMGTRLFMGTHRRQVWPRAHADADHRLVFAVHIPERVRPHSLATRNSAAARGHRHRGRMGHGRHIRSRRVARKSSSHGRRIHAHRLLRGIFSGGASQLLHRQPLWMAHHVCRSGTARAAARLGSTRRYRTGSVEEERKCSPVVGGLASVRSAIF